MKFIVVGGFSAGSHYAIYMTLIIAAGVGEVPSTVAGFLVGTIISYTLNSRFTFQGEQTPETFMRFWLVTLTGGGLNAALVWLLSNLLSVHFAIAGVLAIVVAAAFNFLSHRYWTFADRP